MATLRPEHDDVEMLIAQTTGVKYAGMGTSNVTTFNAEPALRDPAEEVYR